MNIQEATYPALAAALGMQFDVRNDVIYGKRGEYDILVYAENKSAPYALTVHTAAKRSMALTKEEKKEYTRDLKQITSIRQEGNQIKVQQKAISKQEKLQASLIQSVESLLSFLRAKNFQPCCSVCGQNVEVEPYQVASGYMHLCPNCEAGMRGNMMTMTQQEQNKKENVVAGTVGALLGSLLGVLCIILLSRMGYVAAISGVIMAVGVLKGYELLGKKLTKKGIVIGVVLMLVMTYVGDRLDWTIMLYNEVKPDATFFECYRLIPILLQEGVIEMGSYIGNLVMLYIFLLLGAVPTVIGAASEKKTSSQMVKIGSISSFNNYMN